MIREIVREAIEEEIYQAYHGSPCGTIVTGKFKKGKHGLLGGGIYFSEHGDRATHYARKMGNGTLYTVKLNIKNPLVVNTDRPTKEFLKAVYGSDRIYTNRALKQGNDCWIITSVDIKKFLSKGYDGVIWDYAGDREFVVYDNSQIEIIGKEET